MNLVDKDGELTEDGIKLVQETVAYYTPVFASFVKKGYNVFEVLGVITSALINAQKQAWLDELAENEKEIT